MLKAGLNFSAGYLFKEDMMLDSILRMIRLAGKHKDKMVWSVVCAVLSVAAGIIPFFIIHRIIMEFMRDNPDRRHIESLILAAGAALILKAVFFSKATRLSHSAAYKILYNTRIKLAYKLARLPLGYFSDRASGKIKKVMLEDVEEMERFLAHNIPETTSNLIIPVAVTVYLFILDFRMAAAMLITFPAAYLAFIFMMKDSKEKMKKYVEATESMNGVIVEYIKGMAVIKAFNQTTGSFAKYRSSIEEYRKFVMKWYRDAWPYMSAYFVIMPANLVAVLPAGAYFYLNGSLELSVFILFLVISMGFAAPILKLTEFLDGITMISSCESRVNEILQDNELFKSDKPAVIPESFSIRFDSVRFSYAEKETIKGISFTADEGTVTALVGPSGSGKSTVAKLIARFWDISGGEISVGGLNIREIPVEKLMETVSFVFQDVFLFNVSVRDNIKMGRPEATDAEIENAARMAQCHEFIMGMEKGYDTVVGEDGSKLSGGEKQRISIARAILRNAPVIVLDEATSSVDPENEDKIQEALNNLTKGKTLIVIAHRLSTIIHSDKILVINEGVIEAEGRHEELLKKCPLYKGMWEAHVEAMEWEFDMGEVIR